MKREEIYERLFGKCAADDGIPVKEWVAREQRRVQWEQFRSLCEESK